MEDLLFCLDQKSDEVSYLQRKIDSANRMSRIRKRDDSIDRDRRPSKRWRRSREDDSSYDLSPITETRALGHPLVSSTGRDSSAYSGLSAIARLPLQPPGDRPGFAQPLVTERPLVEITRRHPTAPTTSTRPLGNPPPAEKPPPVIINGREYEPVIKVTPPGTLRPIPNIQQQQATPATATSPPPPYEADQGGSREPEESDDTSSEEGATAPKDERSLAMDVRIPQFWGVVRAPNHNGISGQEGLEHDNAMRNMLSRNAYLSQATNMVYVGDSAWEAQEYERQPGQTYSPFGLNNERDNQVYSRSYKGLPLTPYQAKALRTIYWDSKGRFTARLRVEAYLLLWELYTIGRRVTPEHRDRAMSLLMEPNGFDLNPPRSVPRHELDRLRPLP